MADSILTTAPADTTFSALSDAPLNSSNNDPSILSLEDLIAQADARYAIKDYTSAAELYSLASEKQAELNGEMSPMNANLLYTYGRCLYHVAVSKSDVLGSKVAGEQRDGEGGSRAKRRKVSASEPGTSGINGVSAGIEAEDAEQRVAEEATLQVVEAKDHPSSSKTVNGKAKVVENKPYFQFTGDENWDDTDEEEDEAPEIDADAEEEEDDFSNAYEVLDLARVLLERKLQETEESDQADGTSGNGKGKEKQSTEEQASPPLSPATRQIKERIADTHDLQAEISLEGERFPAAITDFQAALELKESLFPDNPGLLAEAHYKLSLALEFSSVTQQKDENGEVPEGAQTHVDEAMREDAAKEMERAIAYCKRRNEREEGELRAWEEGGKVGKPRVTKEMVEDVKGMIVEMEERLHDLRQPPVSLNDPTGTGSVDGSNPLSGILGSILGESPAAQKARVEEASKNANDLTGLVKRKKPQPQPHVNGNGDSAKVAGAREVEEQGERPAPAVTNGKRKVAFVEEEADEKMGSKRARIEDE